MAVLIGKDFFKKIEKQLKNNVITEMFKIVLLISNVLNTIKDLQKDSSQQYID